MFYEDYYLEFYENKLLVMGNSRNSNAETDPAATFSES